MGELLPSSLGRGWLLTIAKVKVTESHSSCVKSCKYVYIGDGYVGWGDRRERGGVEESKLFFLFVFKIS